MGAPNRTMLPRRLSPTAAALLLPSLLLGATLAGVLLVLRGPAGIFGWMFTVVVGIAVLWVLVSSLTPAKADRKCPRCGLDALERLDPASTEGLVCRSCKWTDAAQSSFYLAEDEGVPIEHIVLDERRRKRTGRRSSTAGDPRP